MCKILKTRYDIILRNIPLYSKRKRLVGEIDILAVKDGCCDIYEVKCSFRISKAKRQLRKIKKLMPLEVKVSNLFFFCGDSGIIMEV